MNRDCPQRNQSTIPQWRAPNTSVPWRPPRQPYCHIHRNNDHYTNMCPNLQSANRGETAVKPPVSTAAVEGPQLPRQDYLAETDDTVLVQDERQQSERRLTPNHGRNVIAAPWHQRPQTPATTDSPTSTNVVTMQPARSRGSSAHCRIPERPPLIELNRVAHIPKRHYLYIYPVIGSKQVRALIDSGAQTTLMHHDEYEKKFSNYRLTYEDMEFKGFNNVITTETTGVFYAPITIKNVTRTLRIYVLPNLQHSMLLGDDALRAFGLILDYKKEQVYIQGHLVESWSEDLDFPRYHPLEKKDRPPRPVVRNEIYNVSVKPVTAICRVTHSLNIPPRAIMLARCKVIGDEIEDGELVEVQPIADGLEEMNVMCPRVAATVRDGVVFLPYTNMGNTRARIHAGRRAGMVEPVEVVQTVLSQQDAHEAISNLYGEDNDPSNRTGPRTSGVSPERMAAIADFKDWLTMKAKQEGRNVVLTDGLSVNEAQLTDEDKWYLAVLLKEYSDVFTDAEEPPSGTAMVEHAITLKDPNQEPIKQPYRNLLHHRKVISEEVEANLKKKIIQPSNSPWASPVVIVRKKDGSIRFCVDYRGLNAVTKKDSYPLPRIDETLAALKGSVLFTTLDLQSAYSQIPVKKEDIEKTAFSCHEGLFEYVVMPFGLSNAPATFQRLMQYVLKGLLMEYCMCYLDDVVIFSNSVWDHLYHLGEVLQRLRTAGLKLKPTKCAFAQKSVQFLGHIVSQKGIEADPEKVTKVRDCDYPKSVKQVRQFLGLTGYYRAYIARYGEIAAPLYDLTQACPQNLSFAKRWTPEAAHAFDTLKERLTEAPVLGYPDINRPFKLYTDASNVGLGYVLAQIDESGTERVIHFGSKKLTETETRYAVTEKECLAVVRGFIVFRQYLIGSVVTVYTDHLPLVRILDRSRRADDITPRLLRMAMMIAEYEYTIQYKPGKYHLNADACSRPPIVPIDTDDEVEPLKKIAIKKKQIKAMMVAVREWQDEGPEGQARIRELHLLTRLCQREIAITRNAMPVNVATQTRAPKAIATVTESVLDPTDDCLNAVARLMDEKQTDTTVDKGTKNGILPKTTKKSKRRTAGQMVTIAAFQKGIQNLDDSLDTDESGDTSEVPVDEDKYQPRGATIQVRRGDSPPPRPMKNPAPPRPGWRSKEFPAADCLRSPLHRRFHRRGDESAPSCRGSGPRSR